MNYVFMEHNVGNYVNVLLPKDYIRLMGLWKLVKNNKQNIV